MEGIYYGAGNRLKYFWVSMRRTVNLFTHFVPKVL